MRRFGSILFHLLLCHFTFTFTFTSARDRTPDNGKILLFEIPKYTVNLSFQDGATKMSDSQRSEFDNFLNKATRAHLYGYFETMLLETTDGLDKSVLYAIITNSKPCQGTGTQGGTVKTGICIHISGNAQFKQWLLSEVDDFQQSTVDAWVEGAFIGTEGSNDYQNLVKEILEHFKVEDVAISKYETLKEIAETVTFTNTPGQTQTSAPENTPVDPDVETNPLVNGEIKNPGDNSNEKNSSGTRTSLSATIAVISLFGAAGMFAWKRNRDGKVADGHLLLNVEQYSDYSEDGDKTSRSLSGELQLDETERYYEKYDEEDGIQFIPVPAKFDKRLMDKRTKAVTQNVTPRRYVKAASPFEILYGAAFSHCDQEKVARAHGQVTKKRGKSIKVSGQKIRRNEPLTPMNTISEANEEEVLKSAPSSASEACFPQIMSSISSFMEKRAPSPVNVSMHSNTSDLDEEEEPMNMKKEEFVVYRDFPRHDGTPCVMFTPVQDVEWSDDGPLALSPEGKKVLMNDTSTDTDIDLAHPSPYESPTPKQEDQIDNFVDKLENLIAARSRQYEQRKQHDLESAERKKARTLEKRRKKGGDEHASLLNSDECSSQNEIDFEDRKDEFVDDEVEPTVRSMLAPEKIDDAEPKSDYGQIDDDRDGHEPSKEPDGTVKNDVEEETDAESCAKANIEPEISVEQDTNASPAVLLIPFESNDEDILIDNDHISTGYSNNASNSSILSLSESAGEHEEVFSLEHRDSGTQGDQELLSLQNPSAFEKITQNEDESKHEHQEDGGSSLNDEINEDSLHIAHETNEGTASKNEREKIIQSSLIDNEKVEISLQNPSAFEKITQNEDESKHEHQEDGGSSLNDEINEDSYGETNSLYIAHETNEGTASKNEQEKSIIQSSLIDNEKVERNESTTIKGDDDSTSAERVSLLVKEESPALESSGNETEESNEVEKDEISLSSVDSRIVGSPIDLELASAYVEEIENTVVDKEVETREDPSTTNSDEEGTQTE
eukprot:CAMPEP_0194125812 /NCGR_PEP_ID=MMETSP0150-20130528/59657_1 /TAXON_ID=122233 /ORGANISM="Chaetoceros debilis, Strain MM31A-1" /LENGTH=1007 /DNA_ID=CAMNT_0038819637 /DNA_START=1 /DNA_END=3024 /DNA_ORIENTATION=-